MALKDLKPDDEDVKPSFWATPELERLWAEEAERRYQDYLDGKEEAVPGEEAIRRIRATLL